MITAAAQSGSGGNAVAGAFIVIGGVLLWLLPLIIALVRNVPNAGSVAVIDILLSWTIVGWVVALAMACRSIPALPQPIVPPGPPS